MRCTILLTSTCISLHAVLAAEQPVELKRAPGNEWVEANCGACHSLDYVAMNSRFLSAASWQSELNKMINVFGEPIDETDAKVITAYLIKNYGG